MSAAVDIGTLTLPQQLRHWAQVRADAVALANAVVPLLVTGPAPRCEAVAFAALGTFIIAMIVKRLFGLRVTPQQEGDGLDVAIHGERGYHLDLA